MAAERGPVQIDRKRLRSQRLREVNFQGDALRLGMNWTEDDLRKPQVLVESAYGMGHPSSRTPATAAPRTLGAVTSAPAAAPSLEPSAPRPASRSAADARSPAYRPLSSGWRRDNRSGLVASRVGYRTPSAFVAALRAHTGITPGRYFEAARPNRGQ